MNYSRTLTVVFTLISVAIVLLAVLATDDMVERGGRVLGLLGGAYFFRRAIGLVCQGLRSIAEQLGEL